MKPLMLARRFAVAVSTVAAIGCSSSPPTPQFGADHPASVDAAESPLPERPQTLGTLKEVPESTIAPAPAAPPPPPAHVHHGSGKDPR